jgi:AcrR family transcriptional regulator
VRIDVLYAQDATDQRSRLLSAMVSAAASGGYPATTIDQVAGLAGVSKRDFYAHFASKQECFLEAFDELLAGFCRAIRRAGAAPGAPDRRLAAAVVELARIIEEEPAAVSLVLVDSLSLGAASDSARERSHGLFEQMLRDFFAEVSPGSRVSDLHLRGIVVGARRISYRTIRDRACAELRAAAPALAAWALSYGDGDAAPDHFLPPAVDGDGEAETGRAPAGSWAARAGDPPSRHERLIRAILLRCAEGGYGGLTIPSISSSAETSNRAFYEHFESKEQAVLEAFDTLAADALAEMAGAAAGQGGWEAERAAALEALVARTSGDRLFSSLAFDVLPAVGRPGLERIDAFMGQLAELLAHDEAGLDPIPAELVRQAIVGGIWGMLRKRVVPGRARDDPALAREVVEFTLLGLRGARMV